MRNLLKNSLVRFVIVGCLNTGLGAVLMFVFYEYFHLGYWGSSGASYFLASIFSFFANRTFTFENKESIIKTIPRFAVNIAICYIAAYLMAKPLIYFILRKGMPFYDIREKIALYSGMVLFTALNYFGQKFLVFQNKKKEEL